MSGQIGCAMVTIFRPNTYYNKLKSRLKCSEAGILHFCDVKQHFPFVHKIYEQYYNLANNTERKTKV